MHACDLSIAVMTSADSTTPSGQAVHREKTAAKFHLGIQSSIVRIFQPLLARQLFTPGLEPRRLTDQDQNQDPNQELSVSILVPVSLSVSVSGLEKGIEKALLSLSRSPSWSLSRSLSPSLARKKALQRLFCLCIGLCLALCLWPGKGIEKMYANSFQTMLHIFECLFLI